MEYKRVKLISVEIDSKDCIDSEGATQKLEQKINNFLATDEVSRCVLKDIKYSVV